MTEFTHKQIAYLTAWETGVASVSAACRVAKTSNVTVRKWREENEEFAAAEQHAILTSKDILRDEIRDRSINGVSELVMIGGEPVPLYHEDGRPVLDEDFNPVYKTIRRKKHEDLRLDAIVSGLTVTGKEGITVGVTPSKDGGGKIEIEIVRSDGNGGMLKEPLDGE